jgi:hypothetical protein
MHTLWLFHEGKIAQSELGLGKNPTDVLIIEKIAQAGEARASSSHLGSLAMKCAKISADILGVLRGRLTRSL